MTGFAQTLALNNANGPRALIDVVVRFSQRFRVPLRTPAWVHECGTLLPRMDAYRGLLRSLSELYSAFSFTSDSSAGYDQGGWHLPLEPKHCVWQPIVAGLGICRDHHQPWASQAQ